MTDADKSGSQQTEIRQEFDAFQKRTIRLQHATLWVTFVMALTTAIYAYFTRLQWQEFQNANRRTDTLIDLGIGSLRASNKAVEASRNALRLDQRAWIGVESFSAIAALEAGKPFKVAVVVRNSGRTPANNILSWARLEPLLRDQRPDFRGRKHRNKLIAGGTIPPNGHYTHTLPLGARIGAAEVGTPSQENVNDIKAGKYVVWVYGEMFYDDIFCVRHWMKFCGFYLPVDGTMAVCEQYNDVGDQPQNSGKPCR